MELNKITMWIVGLVVGATLLMGLLYPTISDATATTKTYTNEGSMFAEAGGTHTITTTYNNGTITIMTDGELCTTPTFYFSEVPLLYSSSASVRLNEEGGVWISGMVSVNGAAASNQVVRATDQMADLTIELDGPNATITGTKGTITISDVEYYITHDGPMSLTYKPAIVKESTIIAMSGVTINPSPPGGSTTLYVEGTVDDLTVTPIRTNSSMVVNGTDANLINLKTNLYKIDNIAVNCTQGGVDWICEYTYFLAPHKITYDNPHELDGVEKSLMWVVITMMIVVLVAYAATGIRNKY